VPYSSRPRLPAKMGSDVATCPTAPDLTSRLRWGSGAATCPMAPELAFRLRWALALPRALRLRTSPLSSGGLQRCHVFYDSGARLSAEVSFDAIMYPMTLDLACRLRWALTLSRVLELPVGNEFQA
jgi:hypothetical protein